MLNELHFSRRNKVYIQITQCHYGSLLKLMSIEFVMPSKYMNLYCPLLFLPSVFPSVRVFSNESVDGHSQIRLPRWLSGKEPTCQYTIHRRFRFDPWVGKTPWRRKWQPTLGFLPGESHGQRSLVDLQYIGSQRVGHN